MSGEYMEVFSISPASTKSLWFFVGIEGFLAIMLVALAYTAYATLHSRVEITANSLRLVGDFWGRTIPFEQLRLSEARIVDLESASELSPRRRTFGTGLPGYAAGWFRLRSGEKALVYLTTRQGVVYIPTTGGYALLLSVEEPERFLTALRQRISSM